MPSLLIPYNHFGLDAVNPTLTTDTDFSSAIQPSNGRKTVVITANYRTRCSSTQVESIAENIAYEQTVEVPASLADADERVRRRVGQVESIHPVANLTDTFDIRIVYDHTLAGGQLPQLLNLLFGNTSLQKNITLQDVDLPAEVLHQFRGPRYGLAGLRRILGVHGRPLLATALKPVGLSAEELALLAHEFALGGGDLVKDDHNLHDADFAGFQDRVARCQDAVVRANSQTGRNTLYLPNLMTPIDQIERSLKYILSLGIRGVLVPPFLLGLDTVRSLSERYPVLIMTHPTFSGPYCVDPRHGVETGLLLGKFFRLIGADISVFPNFGGRFSFSQSDCQSIIRHLRSPMGSIESAWPSPAGGMRFDNLTSMARQYGMDAVFLIGGALLSHSSNLKASTRDFLKRIESQFQTRLTEPEITHVSACELPIRTGNPATTNSILSHIPFSPNAITGAAGWQGRPVAPYKTSTELPFQHVTRHELIGQQGEQAAFDLRYFEIGPGGSSSLEKHEHTHTIIGTRGAGVLKVDGRVMDLRPMDVAYIAPWQVHQLSNNSTDEPFGFFCIVDHHRDRPQAP